MLSEIELQQMCDEMTSKFSRLSEELLTSLQQRDVMAGEMEAKNRCVKTTLIKLMVLSFHVQVYSKLCSL